MGIERGVIFDVDGVLVDSYHAHFTSWQMMCRERGLPITQQDFVTTFGRTSREVIRYLWGDYISSDEMIQELDHRKETLFREMLSQDFPAMEGAVALIDRLHDAGYRLALGSSAPPENVDVVIDQMQRRHVFQAIVTGNDVTRGKPDPQVFLIAATRMCLPPSQCLVVEDAPAGITAAHAAGMRCVGFASTGRERETLSAADLVIDGLDELQVVTIEQLLTGSQANGG